jgi:hypothetical protein
MFQPDPSEWPLGFFHTILPPHFTGGMAPTRHERSLAACLENQAAQREAAVAKQPDLTNAMHLCGVLYQAACRLAGAVWHPRRGRFAIGQMTSEMK